MVADEARTFLMPAPLNFAIIHGAESVKKKTVKYIPKIPKIHVNIGHILRVRFLAAHLLIQKSKTDIYL